MPGTTVRSARSYIDEMKQILDRIDCQAVENYARHLYTARRNDRTVWVFGNGGSASCASHHVADYVKTAEVPGHRRLRAFSLCDNKEMLTAIGNDIGYDDIFRHQLESYARPGDVVIAISGSGNSPNVLRACEWAKAHDLAVIALTGFRGGALGRIAQVHVNIPSDNYGIIEDIQLSLGHISAQLLRAWVEADAQSGGLDEKSAAALTGLTGST